MSDERAPQWILKILKWICPGQVFEETEGDVLERFHKDLERKGVSAAKRKLFWNVIRFCRPGIFFRRKFVINFYQAQMLKSYVRIGLRQLVRKASFSVINISGLAIGMTTAFFIFLYLNFEIGYDSFHSNKNELFRVVTTQRESDGITKTSAETFYGVASLMKESFPEVKEAVRCYKWPASTGILLEVDDKIFNERNYLFAESNFFKAFPSMLAMGDASSVLSGKNAAVISSRLALKLFGTTEVIGKSLGDMENSGSYIVVTGLLEDLPANSHFDVDIVRPYSNDWIPEGNQWEWLTTYTYVTIVPGSSIGSLEGRMNEAAKKHRSANSAYKGAALSLQQINDIHFEDVDGNFKSTTDVMALYVVGGSLAVVLLMAWINYINIETARFISRIREVGVRKVIGSSTQDILIQFFVQYMLLYIVAMATAALLCYLLMPSFANITGIAVTSNTVFIPWLWKALVLFVVTGILITGSVPTVVLTRFNPIASIKGQISGRVHSLSMRKSLLVFQFVSSLVLIAFLFVVNDQLEFMRSEKTNLDLSHILTVYNPTNYSAYEDSSRGERNEVLRNLMMSNPSIRSMTSSSAIPGEPVGFTYVDLAKRSMDDPNKQIPYKVMYVDYDFLAVYGLKLKAGRNYSPESASDLNWKSLVITEQAVRDLGFTSNEEALNQEINFMAGSEWQKYTIVGIVEDYRHESVKTPIYPTIFFLHQNRGQMVYYSMAIDKHADRSQVIEYIEATWKKVWPEKPFQYFFMDAYYDSQYKAEIFFANIFGWFAAIAAFIACLGIFGITLFESNSRLKEISIRRVLGATAVNLFNTLNRDHVRLAILSFAIACPVIYYWTNEWLSAYPVRVDVAPTFFIAPPLILLAMIAGISLWQTIKMTQSNPVDHIKHE